MCQDGDKKVSTGCQEGVTRVSRAVKRLSRISETLQEGVKRVVKRVSRTRREGI